MMRVEPQRGRAAANFRPGRFIRDYLAREGSASISEIHRAYKEQYFSTRVSRIGTTIRVPLLNSRGGAYRWPTYESFVQIVAKLRRLELVKVVERASTPAQISSTMGWRGHSERADTAFYALASPVDMSHPAWDAPMHYPEP